MKSIDNKKREEQQTQDEKYMQKCLELAQKAYDLNEVPIGALIVKDGEILGEGFNKKETDKNSLLHAELIAIDEACLKLNAWRLIGCTLYVTVEPCTMCAGAIVNSRIARVVYGTQDEKTGALYSKFNINDLELNHKFEVTSGVLEHECKELMSNFFAKLREEKKLNKKSE